MRINKDILFFFSRQNFTIVSTIDQDGRPHSSCKAIVKFGSDGMIYLLDLYKGKTFENLKRNPNISITAVDEHKFKGYSLKGTAKIIESKELDSDLKEKWENNIVSRITQRILKNLKGGKAQWRHPESLLPTPKYLIAVEIKDVIDLTPPTLK